jgi:hypothetical protein
MAGMTLALAAAAPIARAAAMIEIDPMNMDIRISQTVIVVNGFVWILFFNRDQEPSVIILPA